MTPFAMRPLSLRENAMLLFVFQSLADISAAETLYEQSKVAVIENRFSTMRNIDVPHVGNAVSFEDGPLPVRAIAYDAEDTLLGEILVWVLNGYLSAIEFAWYTDSAPTDLPRSNCLKVEPV